MQKEQQAETDSIQMAVTEFVGVTAETAYETLRASLSL